MAVQSTADRKKRKKWYSVIATKDLQELHLGETLAEQPEELLGRRLHLNLMTLLNDPKKQSITVHFAIKELRGDIGIAHLVHYQLNNSYLKRLVRKTSNKMEESFVITTKDGQICRIKPVLFTRHKVNNSTLTSLRKKAEEHLKQIFLQYTLSELFQFIISNKLQMELKAALKKIYPISSCEIKAFYTEQHQPAAQQATAQPIAQPTVEIQPVQPQTI